MRSRSLLCLLLVLSCASVFGAPITWTLHDVSFNDGGTATGSLTVDGPSLLAYDIAVSGGDTSNFPAFVYQNGAANNTGSQYYYDGYAYDFVFETNLGSPYRHLRLAVINWPASGSVSLYLGGNYAAECYNCAPWRSIVSGYLTSSNSVVPEPATYMVLVPLLGLVFRRRLQRAAGRRPEA